MNFRKVGEEIINLDLITNVRFTEVKNPDEFAVCVFYGEARYLFTGIEALALKKYFNLNSLDLIPNFAQFKEEIEKERRAERDAIRLELEAYYAKNGMIAVKEG